MRRLRVALACVAVLTAVACGSSSAPEATASPELTGRQLRDGAGTADATIPESLAEIDDPTTEPNDRDPADADPDAASEPDLDETTGEPTETATTTTTTTERPRPEIDVVVDELMAFVEQERGHEFVERPPVLLLDTEAFTAAFADLVERDAETYATDFANFTDVYQAVGIIGPDDDLASIWQLFGDAGVIGYYDNIDRTIVLRSGSITPFTRLVLVHELVHALDDQVFDISRDEYDDRDDEISWAFSALVEGNASVIEDRYLATMTEAERAQARDEERNLPRSVSLSIFTNSFLELQFSRYDYGQALAEGLWGQGQAAVDAAFADPVTSSEQVIDLAQYDAAAPDGLLPLPPADRTPFESGQWGQVGWSALFSDVDLDLVDAASGWGGDSWVAWRQDDRACVRAHIAGDTADDLDRYASVLEDWARLGDRQIFYPTADLIRVTACG